MRWRIAMALAVSPLVTGQGLAQGSLADAGERVRQGWLAHNVQAVVGQSASVVLQIPGADPSAAVDRAQAMELLRRHLRAGVERALSVSAVRGSSRDAATRSWTGATSWRARATSDAKRFSSGSESWGGNGCWPSCGVRRNPAPCVNLRARL